MSIFGGRRHPSPTESPEEFSLDPHSGNPGRSPVGFETVLGPSATLRGDLKCQANVRLDGAFEGTLEIDGNVLVGETAKITADIHAKNVSIAGAVRGNVSGKKVQILRTGRVWGDIAAVSIATEDGAFIDGKITMVSHEAASAFDLASLPLPDELEPLADEDLSPAESPQESPEETEAESPDDSDERV